MIFTCKTLILEMYLQLLEFETPCTNRNASRCAAFDEIKVVNHLGMDVHHGRISIHRFHLEMQIWKSLDQVHNAADWNATIYSKVRLKSFKVC